ncbi:hypothetical protein D3876_20105 [Sphingomonas cavernae]|uniref:Uncharacterized protein n=1 Tax=Sphingomonas cavernae TaxID=2320861 RepID=A0A418W7Z6_9SPHN|nr:hypothetical protein D3876_20105 [Sphingomonas cavernae]
MGGSRWRVLAGRVDRAAEARRGATLALSPVSRSALALALVAVPVSAQQSAQSAPPHGAAVRIVPEAGPNAPRMDVAGNGTPIVRIATPSARGVSHNRYTDFNVDDRNLILNKRQDHTDPAGWLDRRQQEPQGHRPRHADPERGCRRQSIQPCRKYRDSRCASATGDRQSIRD